MTSSISLKGWLNKQKHGVCKTFVRRYFVLEGRELRYYKNESDPIPQTIIDLDHYHIISNAPAKKSSQRLHTFLLLSNDEQKQERPDYVLQADSEENMHLWISHLQEEVINSTSVLDKWLKRLDMHTPAPLPSTPLSPPLSSSSCQKQPMNSQSYASLLSPKPRVLRSQRSAESISSCHSLSSSSASFFSTSSLNDQPGRRPSNHSMHSLSSTTSSSSSRFFSAFIPHWSRKSTSSSLSSYSIPRSTSPVTVMDKESGTSSLLHSSMPSSPPVMASIIHPSEYNHDDDPQERLQQRLHLEQMHEQSMLSPSSSSSSLSSQQQAHMAASRTDILHQSNLYYISPTSIRSRSC
ncbi:uncharacterized protein BYT42DRAFT_555664 [Radiomyces spectabilis]|uniref:uncharacterized protein n=1 Tax=Radiomyces spectabilis TaxID=64574 RepID=UPI002220F50D|nr:uncharacterized protein BYT42DRAFT_555664 [Radiomyces spectabilis]KAI8391110.1 hypothetical protein BYT42DRAFT_555664 [Radiomyces spectabilis]